MPVAVIASAQDLAAAGQIAAAAGTLILTAITFGYLLATRRMAESAGQQARSAEAAAAASERQASAVTSALEAQVRPQLTLAGGAERAALTRTQSSIVFRTPVRNDGIGPASVNELVFELDGEPLTRPLDSPKLIPAEVTEELTSTVRRTDPDFATLDAAREREQLDLRIRYRDILGLHHHALPVRLLYDPGVERWLAEHRRSHG